MTSTEGLAPTQAPHGGPLPIEPTHQDQTGSFLLIRLQRKCPPPSRPPWAPPSAEPRPPSAPGPADLTPSWVSCWGVEAPGSGRGQLTDSGLGRPSKSSACSEWDGRWTEPTRQPKRHHVQPAVRPETPHLSMAWAPRWAGAPPTRVHSTARGQASLPCLPSDACGQRTGRKTGGAEAPGLRTAGRGGLSGLTVDQPVEPLLRVPAACTAKFFRRSPLQQATGLSARGVTRTRPREPGPGGCRSDAGPGTTPRDRVAGCQSSL